MSNAITLFKLTKALQRISSLRKSGKKTGRWAELSNEDKNLIREGHSDLKEKLKNIGLELNISKYGLIGKMGLYQTSGNVFPHIWGAFIPNEVGKVSHDVIQLYIFRDSKSIGWGICPSDSALDNKDFLKIVEDAFSENSNDLDQLFSLGIKGKRRLQDHGFNSGVEFYKKHGNAIYREISVEDSKFSDWVNTCRDDLKAMLPLYIKIVNKFREDGQFTKRYIKKSILSGKSISEILNQYRDWDQSKESLGNTKVPNFLKDEIGERWLSREQLFEIGNREARKALIAASEGKNVPNDVVHELIFGSLMRTIISGPWRNKVEENFNSIATLLNKFASKNEFNNEQYEELIEGVRKFTNARAISIITRWLCDLRPDYFLPISTKFTIPSLLKAAEIWGIEGDKKLKYDDYLSICKLAKKVAEQYPAENRDKALYELDHFLYWLGTLDGKNDDSYKDIEKVNSNRRYWKISCGRKGVLAPIHKASGFISIGFGGISSFKNFSSLQDLKNWYTEDDTSKLDGYSADQVWKFSHEIKKGDYIFGYGDREVLLCGEIIGDYQFKDPQVWAQGKHPKEGETHRHILPVNWFSKESISTDKFSKSLKDKLGERNTIKELTRDEASEIISHLHNIATTSTSSILSLEEIIKETGLNKSFFEEIKESLQSKKQVIFSGPPGTGKTYVADYISQWFGGSDRVVKIVQFHPSYSYEDFIEGFRPADQSNKQFERVDGVFKEFCNNAIRNPDKKYVFIIEEINRSNISQVFGELLYLLEYRNKSITLPYSKETFRVPGNVYLIGTMNTTDRSIALIDFALRRRFDFFEFAPDEQCLRNFLKEKAKSEDVELVVKLIAYLNDQVIIPKYGKHYCIGHSYFMKNLLDQNKIKEIWNHSILPLLEEYFYDDLPAIKELTYEKISDKIKNNI